MLDDTNNKSYITNFLQHLKIATKWHNNFFMANNFKTIFLGKLPFQRREDFLSLVYPNIIRLYTGTFCFIADIYIHDFKMKIHCYIPHVRHWIKPQYILRYINIQQFNSRINPPYTPWLNFWVGQCSAESLAGVNSGICCCPPSIIYNVSLSFHSYQ